MNQKICHVIFTTLLASIMLLCGCAKLVPKEPGNESVKMVTTIKDYYPFNPDVKYEYTGKGMEYSSYNLWVDYISGSRIQIRTNNGGTETVKVLEYDSGELKLVFLRNECYYRENFTSKPSNKNEVLLKEPLVKGTSWNLADGRKRYISNVDVNIETPSGSYKALEVTTEGNDEKTQDYYALKTGLIKTLFSSKDIVISSSLSKIKISTPLEQNINFYYPSGSDDKIYYKRIPLKFHTNDITKSALEKSLKTSPAENLGIPLGTNVKINSLYLNNDNMIYVDFSKELVSEMNAGAGYESLILQCIVNTIGNYYGVNKVYITIENEPYSSGHIIIRKGEALTVNFENCIELK